MLKEQDEVEKWAVDTFGEGTMTARERSLRFLEEAIELVQAVNAIDIGDVARLAFKVWMKPPGEPNQELGGTMVSLLGLANQQKLDAYGAYYTEVARISDPAIREIIRAKQAQKLKEGF